MNIFDEFEWRGLVHDVTEGLQKVLAKEKVAVYIGFDPTAASLHVGSLLPILGLARVQRAGHRPIAVAGGGTGLVGDPSGKTAERQLLSDEQVEANVAGIKEQLSHFLDFETKANPAILVNNADWLKPVTLMEFLRDVGKNFTVNYMLAKESVKRRLEQEDGISFTEFSYMVLQAYDFLVMYDRYGCTVQMGGSDQWGNVTAGIDLIRRVRGGRAYGLVYPLVMTSAGVKFGKTEAGTVWLSPEMTSPLKFYQYWLNTEDCDVITYLKYFTWLDAEEIAGSAATLERAPEKREAQRRLAREMTTMLHGPTECEKAERASQVLFGGEIVGLSGKELLEIFQDVPSSELSRSLLTPGITLVDLAVQTGVTPSKSEARRLIQSGGLYLNNRRVTDMKYRVTMEEVIEEEFLVMRKGARSYHVVRVGKGVGSD